MNKMITTTQEYNYIKNSFIELQKTLNIIEQDTNQEVQKLLSKLLDKEIDIWIAEKGIKPDYIYIPNKIHKLLSDVKDYRGIEIRYSHFSDVDILLVDKRMFEIKPNF